MLSMILSGVLVLLLDLSAKRMIELRGPAGVLHFGSFVRVRHVASRRRSYSFASFRTLLLLVWIGALAASITLAATGTFSSWGAQIAIGAALGGAAGNLFDILRTRSVRDYIDLGWWPVFNLADVAILGGLAVAFLER